MSVVSLATTRDWILPAAWMNLQEDLSSMWEPTAWKTLCSFVRTWAGHPVKPCPGYWPTETELWAYAVLTNNLLCSTKELLYFPKWNESGWSVALVNSLRVPPNLISHTISREWYPSDHQTWSIWESSCHQSSPTPRSNAHVCSIQGIPRKGIDSSFLDSFFLRAPQGP